MTGIIPQKGGKFQESSVQYLRSLWNAASPLKPPFHALVSEIDRFTEHERAASNDALDAVCLARSNGLLRNAAISKGSMEPDSRHTVVTTLSYDLNRNIRPRRNHDTVKGPLDGSHVAITSSVLDLRGIRVDRKHVIANIPQFAEHGVCGLVRIARDARYSYPLSTKKPCD
jgi:hypothetical protein